MIVFVGGPFDRRVQEDAFVVGPHVICNIALPKCRSATANYNWHAIWQDQRKQWSGVAMFASLVDMNGRQLNEDGSEIRGG